MRWMRGGREKMRVVEERKGYARVGGGRKLLSSAMTEKGEREPGVV